jgi:transglutaminase-like putative cysteine protease
LIYAGDWGKYYCLHAWNEVVVNGTWMSVDPSRGKPEITPLYIRFSQDHDKEVKILSYIPEMKIEILAVDLDE